MKITIFSSNQPRHLNLARLLAEFADEVFFISEVNTVFPGRVKDFYQKSDVMQEYFSKVINAEKKIFGKIAFNEKNVKSLSIKMGDLNKLDKEQLHQALLSDIYIVFGASYIKGWLVDFLVQNKAINIHMGLSPYYRGSSCNFWALYDNRPEFVGATIHLLSKGLDSGDMLFHCVPKIEKCDSPFDFTMRSVKVAHESLTQAIKSKDIFSMDPVSQNNKKEIRYSKNIEFTNAVATDFLNRDLDLQRHIFNYPELLNPIFGK